MRKKILFIIFALLLVTLACNISQETPTPDGNAVATSVALTVEAGGQAPPTVAGVPSPLPTMTPAIPPTVTFTPTIALSPTPSVPMASVSENTNCRTGPGKVYDYIGAFTVGEKAEVVGKNTPSGYWIIKNPDASGNCWLWGYYATVVGNTANLQEYAIPPTPTPSIPLAPSNLAIAKKENVVSAPPNCTADFTLTWDDLSDNEGGFNLYQDAVKIASYESSSGTSQLSVVVSITAQDGIPFEFGVTAFNVTGESARAIVPALCP